MKRLPAWFLFLYIPVAMAANTFEVIDVTGPVMYRAPSSFKKEEVSKGMQLQPKGRVLLKSGHILALKTPMGDTIRFRDKSYVRLDRLDGTTKKSDCRLELFVGKVNSSVHKLGKKSSFSIKTPVAVVGVRGTEFACRVVETGDTDVLVYTGEVGVQDVEGEAPPSSVPAGSAAKVKPDGKVSVRVVPGLKKRVATRKAAAQKAAGKKSAAKKNAAGKDPGKKGPAGTKGPGQKGPAPGSPVGGSDDDKGKPGPGAPAAEGTEDGAPPPEGGPEEGLPGTDAPPPLDSGFDGFDDQAFEGDAEFTLADDVSADQDEDAIYTELIDNLTEEINTEVQNAILLQLDEEQAEELEAQQDSINLQFEVENVQ